MPDPSHVCDLHHSSQQCWILNPLDQTRLGIKPASWFLVGFVSAVPWWELLTISFNLSFSFFLFFFFLSFCLFAISQATPAAYGGSQARGPIGAVATCLYQSHSNAGSEPCLQPILLAICISSLENSLFGSFAHFSFSFFVPPLSPQLTYILAIFPDHFSYH